MVEKLSEILEGEQYTTKCLADNTIQVNCRMSDNYRKIITFVKKTKLFNIHINLKKSGVQNSVETYSPFYQN
jgi:hypothetical protein